MAYVPQKQEVMVTKKLQVTMAPHEFDPLFQKYFGIAWQDAKRVGNCESRLNPKAGENGYNIGVMQINIYGKLGMTRPSKEWLLDAENNIKYASTIFKSHKTFRKAWVVCAKKTGAR